MAASDCTKALPEALRLRRREKISKLPLHMELGEAAMQDVINLLPTGVGIRTQWSNLGKVSGVFEDMVNNARALATLAEKGDERFWDIVALRTVMIWAPSDLNALIRLLAHYSRRRTPNERPENIYFLVAMPDALCTGDKSDRL